MSDFGSSGGYGILQDAYGREGRLFAVHCDLLYQCDLDCGHCYLDEKGTRNRDTAFWKGVFDQLGEMGVALVILSGGEIFLRPDLLDLVAHARSHGLIVQLKTHGGLIGEAEARRLAELGVSEVQVSYYSHIPEAHDQITRRPGSHQATLRAMKLLVAHGVDVVAGCCAMGPNYEHLEATQAQCTELGVQLKFSSYLFDGVNGSTYPRELALTREQATTVATQTASTKGEACTGGSLEPGWGEQGICMAGHAILYVDPEGRVTPCIMWQQTVGDLTAGDRIVDIWGGNEEMDRVRAFRKRDRQGCSSCDAVSECSFCPGANYTENRDPMAPAPAVCESAYAKATANARWTGGPEPAPPPGLTTRAQFPIVTTAQLHEITDASPSPT